MNTSNLGETSRKPVIVRGADVLALPSGWKPGRTLHRT
jgi:hypothetical protein